LDDLETLNYDDLTAVAKLTSEPHYQTVMQVCAGCGWVVFGAMQWWGSSSKQAGKSSGQADQWAKRRNRLAAAAAAASKKESNSSAR
jgi:hypothetical protein